jgi:glutathione S-transferase
VRFTWIVGDWFTAPDVMLGSCAIRMRADGTLLGFATIEAYAERCLAPNAYRRARVRCRS